MVLIALIYIAIVAIGNAVLIGGVFIDAMKRNTPAKLEFIVASIEVIAVVAIGFIIYQFCHHPGQIVMMCN